MDYKLPMEFIDFDGEHKVIIFERNDGGFSFEEWKLVVEEIPRGEERQHWVQINRDHSIPICETFDIALREARGRIPWMKEVLPDD